MTLQSQTNAEFQYPYKEELCLKHRLATRIWRGITEHDQQHQICECCGRKVGLQNVQKNCKPNSSEFAFLGPGIPLFFKFLKYSIGMLVVFCLVFSIYGLYTNVASKNCQHNQNCVLTVFNSMSIVNKKSEYYLLRIQNYILIAFVVCCFILLHIFRYRFRKTEEKVDKLNVTASDYSIILKRLPSSLTTKQGLQKSIQKMIDQQISTINFLQSKKHHNTGVEPKQITCKIESIIFSYDVTDFLAEKENQICQFKNQIKDNSTEKFVSKKLPEPSELGEIAIVVFSDQQTKKHFIHEPSFLQNMIHYFFSAFPPLSHLRVDNKLVAIERAPEPEDILWQNAHITPCQRTVRKVLLNSVSFIFLILGGACQYGLALWQIEIQDSKTKVLVGTIASICVTVTNTILTTFLVYSTIWERMGTQSEYLEVLTFKLIIQQFLNSGVFVVAANVLANFSDSMLENSLADTITQIMILNAITPNVTVFFMKHFEIIDRVKRLIFLRTDLFIKTQMEANKLYELPKPDFTQKYSYIVKTLWLTAFYAPFVPIVVPISAAGLTINYFIEKFLFSRSYSIASKISASLNNSCMEGLEFIPLIFSVGQFLIYIYLQTFFQEAPDDWLIPIYVCLGLSLLNLALPMEQFNEKIEACIQSPKIESSEKNEQKVPSFQEAKEIFEITYEMTYPANDLRRGKRKDTIIEKKIKDLTAEVVIQRPSIFGLKLGIPLIQQSSSSQKSQKREEKVEEQQSDCNINITDTQGTPSLLKNSISPVKNEPQLVMIRKASSESNFIFKFSTDESTRIADSEINSISEYPARFMEMEPEPGKLFKNKEEFEKNSQSQEEARKLFEYYEQKKLSNKLIEIKEENEEDDKVANL